MPNIWFQERIQLSKLEDPLAPFCKLGISKEVKQKASISISKGFVICMIWNLWEKEVYTL